MVILQIHYQRYAEGKFIYENCPHCSGLIFNSDYLVFMVRTTEGVSLVYYHFACIELKGLVKQID